jgi:hypothetical protein
MPAIYSQVFLSDMEIMDFSRYNIKEIYLIFKIMLSYKTWFIILFIIGILLCSWGIGKIAAGGDWLSPFAFIGYILGLSALILFISVIFNLKTSHISSAKQALVVLAVIMVTKIIIGFIYLAIKK